MAARHSSMLPDSTLSIATTIQLRDIGALIKIADRIHRFPAKMSPKLAQSFLESTLSGLPDCEHRQLRFHDPLCGSATTALTARGLGFSVSGCDISYPAYIIGLAKLYRLPDKALNELTVFPQSIELSGKAKPMRQWPNWQIWYTGSTLRCLEDLAFSIFEVRRKAFFPHLLTALFQTVWDVSSADKRVIVPTRSRFSKKPPVLSPSQVLCDFRIRLARILRAQEALRMLNFGCDRPDIRLASALEEDGWPRYKVDVVLSSPPYGCGIDYERAFRLQMRIWKPFVNSDYRRSQIIGRINRLEAGIEALPVSERKSLWYRKVHTTRERFRPFLQYLGDMRQFLSVSHRHISKQGRLCLVIGNPEIARHQIPLARIVRKLAESEGFILQTQPGWDRIRGRIQQFRLRSATQHIKKEALLVLRPM
jgi:hypothetical protein